MVAPQYETHQPDAAFRFGVACREAFPGFLERLQTLASWDMGFRKDGMLVANRSPSEEAESRRALAFQAAAGLPGEILSPDDARRIHGQLAPEVPSWLWLPGEAQVDTQRLAVALADAVQAAGVRLVRGGPVASITTQGFRATGVRLAGETRLEADAVVLAAGAWSGGMDGLPRELPVRPVRGQILRLLLADPLPWTLVCNHDGQYLVPRINRTVLVGSTMEEAGFDDGVTEEGREVLATAAASLIPALADARIVEAWAGLRPLSADGWPILGPEPEVEGLFYATGHGRHGILYAPLTGKAVAELVVDGVTEVEWEAFGIQRF
jgi:glycine oxidase